MKRNLLTVLILSSGLILSACNDSDDNGSSIIGSTDPNANNITNPVVGIPTAYSKDDMSAVAAESVVMTYKMKGVNDKETQATALVFVPKTTPPAAGWPVVAWAHGTTGVADKCAPSQQGLKGTEVLLKQLLAQGYVVVAPDYEGLGEPSGREAHPFLNLKSEAYSITDAVVAARDYIKKQGKPVSKDWLAIGHSQGGQAALGAAQYASRAQLNYKGTIAVAPASNLSLILLGGEAQANGMTDLSAKISTLASLDTYTALITAGLRNKNPQLTFSQVFKSPTDTLAQSAETLCSGDVGLTLGGGMMKYASENNYSLEGYPRTQSNFLELSAVSTFLISESQPLQVKLNQPVIIYQGGADATVPKKVTDFLLTGDGAKQSNITYRTEAEWDHTTAYTANLANIVNDVKSMMPAQ
ncbi:alpha/beta hydrolase [Acinetobacter wuhouensis]|uniref:Alpha/beta fold hydrolase n=1 Tax=Acinetobacter wuhouensis TaxID=1879050 RepID=A0A3G2T448_9GAMM|nr:alpha/beta fold hydrolase [Acinetobacter wuhouensis]AYO54998.1 alpha/beta fold hydrolase [Acinetobacter wuhouensis]